MGAGQRTFAWRTPWSTSARGKRPRCRRACA